MLVLELIYFRYLFEALPNAFSERAILNKLRARNCLLKASLRLLLKIVLFDRYIFRLGKGEERMVVGKDQPLLCDFV